MELLYFFHPGSCRCRGCGGRYRCICLEGQTLEEADWCIEQTLFRRQDRPLNMILDDGGDPDEYGAGHLSRTGAAC